MNIIKITFVLIAGLALAACSVESNPQPSDQTHAPTTHIESAESDSELQKNIAEIAKEANGKVGVYATVIETGQTVSLNPNDRFAMQSVVKLPIAMAVLKMVR